VDAPGRSERLGPRRRSTTPQVASPAPHRTDAPDRLLVLVGVEAEQLHLDEIVGIELELMRRERRWILAAGADRRELDDDPLVALDQGVDQQLVGAGSRTRDARTNRCSG